jgi:hypothetical protein
MSHSLRDRDGSLTEMVTLPINQAHQLTQLLYGDRDRILNLPFAITVNTSRDHWNVWLSADGVALYHQVKEQLDAPMTYEQAMR